MNKIFLSLFVSSSLFITNIFAEDLLISGAWKGRALVVENRSEQQMIYEAQATSLGVATAITIPATTLERHGMVSIVTVSDDGEIQGTPLVGKDIVGSNGFTRIQIGNLKADFQARLLETERHLEERESARYEGLKELALQLESGDLRELADEAKKLQARLQKLQKLKNELSDFDKLLQELVHGSR